MSATSSVCSKCGESRPIQRHHFYPQVHFGTGVRNPHTIGLCESCHIRIETIILSVESFVGDVKFGSRFRMDREHYERIHRHWLRNAKVISLRFS